MKDGTLTAVRRRSVETTELSPDGYLALKEDLEAIELGVRRKPQFVARDAAREANVRMAYDHRTVHLETPFSWTVTNVWEKEVLTVPDWASMTASVSGVIRSSSRSCME